MPKVKFYKLKPCADAVLPEDIPVAIAEVFEQAALQAAAAGRERYSAQGLIERIRWHTTIERRGDFKANNNWSAPLARWFLAKHPELPDFFATRQRRARDA